MINDRTRREGRAVPFTWAGMRLGIGRGPWTSQGSRMVVAFVDSAASLAASTGWKGMVAASFCFATRLTRSWLPVPASDVPGCASIDRPAFLFMGIRNKVHGSDGIVHCS